MRGVAVPVRDTLVPVVRTAVPLRETPEERVTLVRPVEERRVAVLRVAAVLPPARVRPLLRPEAPPRET